MVSLLDLFIKLLEELKDTHEFICSGYIYGDEQQEVLDNAPIEVKYIDCQDEGYESGSQNYMSIFRVKDRSSDAEALIGYYWWYGSWVGSETEGDPFYIEEFVPTETRYRKI